jgi:predicted nucleic acid-binding protein
VPIESVVADANVLLSAVTGKAALRVFTEFQITVHVARFSVDEVTEYLPEMARQYDLPPQFLEMQWKLLPVRVHTEEDYHRYLKRSLADMAARDREDAHALALARKMRLPLWSNDRDLAGLDVECFSTARLLAVLTRQRRAGNK